MSLNICHLVQEAYLSPKMSEYAIYNEGLLCTSGLNEDFHDDGEQDW